MYHIKVKKLEYHVKLLNVKNNIRCAIEKLVKNKRWDDNIIHFVIYQTDWFMVIIYEWHWFMVIKLWYDTKLWCNSKDGCFDPIRETCRKFCIQNYPFLLRIFHKQSVSVQTIIKNNSSYKAIVGCYGYVVLIEVKDNG